MICYIILFASDKDVLRTDRDCSSYSSLTSPKLRQMEDILRTYAMYNFDLGMYVCQKLNSS